MSTKVGRPRTYGREYWTSADYKAWRKEYLGARRGHVNAINKAWRQAHPVRAGEMAAKANQAVKRAALSLYADPPQCVKCGFGNILALVLDHINDDGATQRNKHGFPSGSKLYSMIKRQGKIEGLQVLCANCNTIKQAEKCRQRSVDHYAKKAAALVSSAHA